MLINLRMTNITEFHSNQYNRHHDHNSNNHTYLESVHRQLTASAMVYRTTTATHSLQFDSNNNIGQIESS